MSETENRQEPKSKARAEGYSVVRFEPKSRADDTPNVQLMVNGETLVVQRGVEVTIPDRFVECAEHATYDNWIQDESRSDRKIRTKVKLYPFQRLGAGRREDFDRMRREGTRQLLRDLNMTEDELGKD